ncbi:hypothetical protein [Zooshikella ganghwensis]|nr:hypothetical protein [Zooshikella ganghwensis]
MGHKVVTDKDIAAALHNNKDINDQIWDAARQKTYVKVYRTTLAVFNFTLALQNICAVFTDDTNKQQEQELVPFIFQVVNDVVTLTDGSLKLYNMGVQWGLVAEKGLVNATLNRIALYFLVVSTLTAASSTVESIVDDQPVSLWIGDLVDTVGNLSLLTGWLITAPGTPGVAGIAGLVSRAAGFIFGSATNPIGWFLLILGSLWAVFSLIKDVIRAHQPELFKWLRSEWERFKKTQHQQYFEHVSYGGQIEFRQLQHNAEVLITGWSSVALDGLEWTGLNWRAVIPLHNAKFPTPPH